MKPTFDIHFSEERPKEPGLWLCRRQNLISVLELQKSDIDHDTRTGNWLVEGEWGGRLNLVNQDMVSLTRKEVCAFLDKAITEAEQRQQTERAAAFQFVRENLVGNP